MGNLLIRSGGEGSWKEPKSFQYAREVHLQETLADYPSLIPGVGIRAKVRREFESGAGPADLIVVDSDASLTLVECKLASNPQVRREIIGQVFDYASGFWKMSVSEFERRWAARAANSGTEQALFDHSAEEEIRLRQDLADNLEQGRFRIVLAVDKINPDLKRIVEYLNAMAGPETVIIAVEYTRLTAGDVEILIPKTYGEEIAEAKEAAEGRQQRTWTVEEYQAWIAENDRSNAGKFSALITAADKYGIPFVGSPARLKGSIPAGGLRLVDASGGWVGTVYIYYYAGAKTFLELSFANKENRSNISRLDPNFVGSLLASLEAIPHFGAAAETLRVSDFSKRPNVPLSDLPHSAVDDLMDVLNRLRTAPPAPSL